MTARFGKGLEAAGSTALENLFSPIKIGSLQLKNRLVMSPMALNYSSESGNVTQRQMDYYAARARGGVGLIMSESFYVLPEGRGNPRRQGLYDDSMIDEHKRLTAIVHQHDTPMFADLHHAGVRAPISAIGSFPVAPSAIPFVPGGWVPRELTVGEIQEIVEAYGRAAARAKAANYDGIQIHAGHGYLINEFLSPHYNQRDDQYGKDREGRSRLLMEVLEKVRQVVGADFPISVRLTVQENMSDGYRLDFTHWLVKHIEGLIDEVCVSSGNHEDREWIVPPMCVPEGFRAEQAAGFKKITNRLIGVVGRITNPLMADEIVGAGQADLIYMGRALLADPELPRKAQKGVFEEIRPCLGCNKCVNRLNSGGDVRCTVNPTTGQEGETGPSPLVHRKKVLVVGGGPAGLEAAARAAGRGHEVTLMEAQSRLGGKLHVAAAPPGRTSIAKLVGYLEKLVRREGVKVETGVWVTPEIIQALNPDTVILATGNHAFYPPLPGIALDNVCSAEDVLNETVRVEGRAVIIGGGMVGLETADFLTDRQVAATVLEMKDVLAPEEDGLTKKMLFLRLNKKGVAIHMNCEVEYISADAVAAKTVCGRKRFPANKVIIATGYIPGNDLVRKYDLGTRETYIIGDANGKHPASFLDAVRDGFLVGSQV
jgi:2,4-dienoyl-CoA reductase-like NADH-dependent reductase (Old Yellow Enzyme family)/thioredoxin reductase